MEPFKAPKVRLGTRVYDPEITLGSTPTKKFEGRVLKPLVKKLRQYVTISTAGQKLEVHKTDEETGIHTPVLRIDFYWVASRLSDPGFMVETRQRWISRSLIVPSARELRAIGTNSLMLVPTDDKALLPDADGVVDAPAFHSVAMRGLRHAPPGTTWAALAAPGECLGLVWSARVSRRRRLVLFTPWSDTLALLHWFLSELAGPSGYIPPLEEHDVA